MILTISTETYGKMYRGVIRDSDEKVVYTTAPYHHRRNAYKAARNIRSNLYQAAKERAKARS